MSNRGRRGGAAALFAARMTEELEPTDEEIETFGVPDTDPADDTPTDDEPEDDGPSIDYSHIEDEPADEESEPEKPAEPDAVAELRAQLDAMQAERDAEKARAAVLDEAASLRQDQVTVSRALGQAKGALNTAKADYAKAAAAGDWTTAAEHQATIAAATADIREFEGAADEIAKAVEDFNRGKRRAAESAPKQPADPFETAISNMSDASKEWCRRNKADLQKSPARGVKAQALHLEAVDAGLKPDTAEYFAYLDEQMGYQPVTKKTTKTPRPTGQPRVAAPAGGRSGVPSAGANDVKLSADEVAMAKQMGMSTKVYAARKLEIIKNGKDPSRGGPTYSNTSHLARR